MCLLGLSWKWKMRYCQKKYCSPNALNQKLITIKTAIFVAHASKVRGMHLKKIPPMEAEIQL